MVRVYDPEGDREGLWALKQAFERELGSGTGGETKAQRYEAKLTDAYRDRYLAWVERCVEEEEGTIHVADGDDGLVGYVFVLPSSLSMIWDAAVLNEVYVEPGQRGTGVADDLMTAAIEHCRDQSLPLDRLVLDVDPDNERARAFYDRYGFESWGELVAREL